MKMKISKQDGLAVVFAVALSACLPGVGHAATYNLNIGSNGSFLASPVGTVDITGGGTTLTYTFDLSSDTLKSVYIDVTGSVSGVSDNFGSAVDSHSFTTALGTFTDTLNLPLLEQNSTQLTVTFTGTNLGAAYTLLDGNIEMFSAATTSNGLFADTPATPIPATLPLFAGGLGALGLLTRRRKRANAAAIATT